MLNIYIYISTYYPLIPINKMDIDKVYYAIMYILNNYNIIINIKIMCTGIYSTYIYNYIYLHNSSYVQNRMFFN